MTLVPPDVLHILQTSELFPDSKTFVDRPLLVSPEEAEANFRGLQAAEGRRPSRESLVAFVARFFGAETSGLEPWMPSDWRPELPRSLEGVCARFLPWAKSLHETWVALGRRTSDEVSQEPHKHSLLPREHGFVVPGGRFRESYYWDSYWIVLGLLVSGMRETVKGILRNMMDDVRDYGHVPNGGRKYYLSRSQPPVFLLSVKAYLDDTNDLDFLEEAIPALLLELEYWYSTHAVMVQLADDEQSYTLFRYCTNEATPRPESYIEDCLTAGVSLDGDGIEGVDDRALSIWQNLRSAAESGWDFSSRWIHPQCSADPQFTLANTNVLSVVPIDLNSIMYKSLHALADMMEQLEDKGRTVLNGTVPQIRQKAVHLGDAIKALLFDDESLLFLDLWTVSNPCVPDTRGRITAASAFAAWAGLYDGMGNPSARRLRNLLARGEDSQSSELRWGGGIQTTTIESGEQWDAPNAWPPLQHIAVEALEKLGFHLDAKELATDWLESTHKAWALHSAMFEKMNAKEPGSSGGGGEYVIQEGFGWSNGVALRFLRDFANEEV